MALALFSFLPSTLQYFSMASAMLLSATKPLPAKYQYSPSSASRPPTAEMAALRMSSLGWLMSSASEAMAFLSPRWARATVG